MAAAAIEGGVHRCSPAAPPPLLRPPPPPPAAAAAAAAPLLLHPCHPAPPPPPPAASPLSDRLGSVTLESDYSMLSERDCWHCSIERELCLTIVVAGALQGSYVECSGWLADLQALSRGAPGLPRCCGGGGGGGMYCLPCMHAARPACLPCTNAARRLLLPLCRCVWRPGWQEDVPSTAVPVPAWVRSWGGRPAEAGVCCCCCCCCDRRGCGMPAGQPLHNGACLLSCCSACVPCTRMQSWLSLCKGIYGLPCLLLWSLHLPQLPASQRGHHWLRAHAADRPAAARQAAAPADGQ